MLPRMEPGQVCAIMRLRWWAHARCNINNAKAINFKKQGWRKRRERAADAAIVQVIDFERALGQLSTEEQALLIGKYRDHYTEAELACVASCSVRKIAYALPDALTHLAQILERLNLL